MNKELLNKFEEAIKSILNMNDTVFVHLQIQGSGAELLKQTLINLKQKYPSLDIANVIHDEIIIECYKEEANDIANALKQEMEQAWDLLCDKAKIPIKYFKLEVEQPDVIKSIAK